MDRDATQDDTGLDAAQDDEDEAMVEDRDTNVYRDVGMTMALDGVNGQEDDNWQHANRLPHWLKTFLVHNENRYF